MRQIVKGLRHFHRTNIAPQMPTISVAVSRDVTLHSDTVTTGRLETLVGTLHPTLRWQSPVLTIDMPHVERDQYLRCRGLRLVPSFFCWRYPIMLFDPDLPPVLVYPLRHHQPGRKRRPGRCLTYRWAGGYSSHSVSKRELAWMWTAS
jgi:hypothetical protein